MLLPVPQTWAIIRTEIRKRLRGSQMYMQKDFFAEFCEVPPSSMEYLFRRLQEDPFFNNPSNTQALQFSTTRTQATQFAIPSEKLKCGASLFKKS